MDAITGITGKVGGEVAHTLLKAGHVVRAVIRDPRKGAVWAQLGCEVAVSDMSDVVALTAAFSGARGVFVLLPPVFDPSPDFPETRATVAACDKLWKTPVQQGLSAFRRSVHKRSGKTADAVEHHGAIAGRFADPHQLPAAGVVHGELQLGRHRGA